MKEKELQKWDFFLIFLHPPVLEHTFSALECPFPVLERPFPVSERHFPVLECPFSVLERLFPGFWGVILSRDICSCPCPGTKGHLGKNLFCPGTKGQRDFPSRFVPGRPMETNTGPINSPFIAEVKNLVLIG